MSSLALDEVDDRSDCDEVESDAAPDDGPNDATAGDCCSPMRLSNEEEECRKDAPTSSDEVHSRKSKTVASDEQP